MLGQNNTGGSCFTFASSVNANNQLDSPYQYDAGGYTYNWDAESQLTSALSNLGGQFYVYDGDGKRVSDGHLYWYGPHGELLGLTDGSGNLYSEYIYLGSRLIAQVSSSSAAIYIPDSLGSSRVVTNQSGVVYYGADFTPFGGERAYHTSWSPLFKFEGKQRDNYTSNDDFGARYYSNRWGRWLSADWSNVPVAVPYANLTNPQTLNLYSMVADDPESFADLDGHNATWASLATFMATGCGGSDTTTFCVAEAEDIANNTESQGTVTGQAQNQLSTADVVKIIQQAQRSSTDPATTAINIFNGLGNNVSVTGDNLRAGLSQTGVTLDPVTQGLVSNIGTVTKSGNQVSIENTRAGDVKVEGNTIKIARSVGFEVGKLNGNPALTNISGISGKKGILSTAIKSVEVVRREGHTFLHVSTGIGYKPPPIPVD